MKTKYFFLILVTLFTACREKQGENQSLESEHQDEHSEQIVELTPAQYESAGIVLASPAMRNLSGVIQANGVIDIPPSNLVSISAPMGGFVRQTDLLQGMKVKKGQVLAIIENPDFIPIQQEYLETASELEYAETDFARQEQLSSGNISAKKTLELAMAKLKGLKARLAGLTEKLRIVNISVTELEKGKIISRVPITSPLTGSVTVVNVNLGKYVTPTDVMFEIVDTDHLHVELSVFERDAAALKLGQKVRFTVNDGPEELATVYLINPKINEDRTVRVHCHLVKNDPALLPQNFVRAAIETGSSPVLSLPDNAILNFEEKSYIFALQNGASKLKSDQFVFEMIAIEKGVSEKGYTHVIFPKAMDSPASDIVVKGGYALLSKLKNSDDDHGH
jgi:membrane fusion protein, heavy metal efflux system